MARRAVGGKSRGCSPNRVKRNRMRAAPSQVGFKKTCLGCNVELKKNRQAMWGPCKTHLGTSWAESKCCQAL